MTDVASEIEVVSNSPAYFEFIRELRNDPRVNRGFIEEAHITPEQQTAYMSVHANGYVIALVGDRPAGYAGSVEGDIRVCTHPDFQGMGVGRALIRELMRRFPRSVAKIKIDNVASRRLFESCGFATTFVLMELGDDRDATDAN